MKKLIITAFLATNIIGCGSSPKQKNGTENIEAYALTKEEADVLPDSLFYRINMSFFDMRSIPYDESIGSQRLKLATGTFRQKVINAIKELEGLTRTNVMYLSKQMGNENGFLITVYTDNEIDPGSIYLLSLDKKLDIIDYRKLGYEKCDLEDQTDTCAISFCDIIVTYKIRGNAYTVVSKNEKSYDCKNGKTKKVETDSTLLTIKDQKFYYKKLQ